MSAEESESDTMMFCASCGTAGSNDIKLKKCTACLLVRYCGVKCQKDHRLQHKKECKKRAAELKDELLFKQPESSCYGDCPICCLPLPVDVKKSTLNACCGKQICKGCDYANMKREKEGRLQHKCPFCRKAPSKTQAQSDERLMKRIEVNDPIAISDMGTKYVQEGDYKRAVDHYSRAIALGDVDAHFQLSCLYRDGKGVEKDKNKQMHHLEEAAIAGHPHARHNLGCVEDANRRVDRAVKHFIIAAKLGVDLSLDAVKKAYSRDGLVSKDDYTAALRGYQVAIAATESAQREEAYEFWRQVEEFERSEGSSYRDG